MTSRNPVAIAVFGVGAAGALLCAGVLLYTVGRYAMREMHQQPPNVTVAELRHVAAEVFSHNDEVVFAEQAVLTYRQGCEDAGGAVETCATKAEAFKRATFPDYLDSQGNFVFENMGGEITQ